MTGIRVNDTLEHQSLFKISKFKEKIKRTKPHKHGPYYEFIYLESGEGFHWIDTQKFQLKTAELYFMRPNQLHCWQFTSLPRGYVMLIREDFFDPIYESKNLSLLRQINENIRFPDPDQRLFKSIFDDLFATFETSGYEENTDLILGYLRVLLSKLISYQSRKITKASNESISLYHSFIQLLESKSPIQHQVKEYASLLNTSPQNLNMACRKQSDKSASQHINEQLILEIKRYLLHSDYSINEISELLHFKDSSHFVKFFKKSQNNTPLQFRNTFQPSIFKNTILSTN